MQGSGQGPLQAVSSVLGADADGAAEQGCRGSSSRPQQTRLRSCSQPAGVDPQHSAFRPPCLELTLGKPFHASLLCFRWLWPARNCEAPPCSAALLREQHCSVSLSDQQRCCRDREKSHNVASAMWRCRSLLLRIMFCSALTKESHNVVCRTGPHKRS